MRQQRGLDEPASKLDYISVFRWERRHCNSRRPQYMVSLPLTPSTWRFTMMSSSPHC